MNERRALDAIELIATGLVGMTALAVAESGAPTELTLSQWRALAVVSGSEGIRVGEVAARIGASVPSASRLIQRLERRSLVTTERDEADRRATIVRVTEEGARTRARVVQRRRELVQRAIAERGDPIPGGLDTGLEAIGEAISRYM